MGHCVTKLIPNMLTCCNLVSGCVATVFALDGNPRMALAWIITGALFDFFDGMSARLLHVSSPIGKELDSLADDITFGVAPAAIVFAELSVMDYPPLLEPIRDFLPYSAFVMAAFSALRLAKFNLDERQSTSFIGMPTPANALFWGSLVAAHSSWVESSPLMVYAMLALVGLCSWLMIAEIPMFALKFKNWGWRGNEIKYCFMIFSALAIFAFGFMGCFSLIIPCYLIISVSAGLRKGTGKTLPTKK